MSGGSQLESEDSDSSNDVDFEKDDELNEDMGADTWYAHTKQKETPTQSVDKTEMKRQENIYEIIHTEANHHRTLLIMQVKLLIVRLFAKTYLWKFLEF